MAQDKIKFSLIPKTAVPTELSDKSHKNVLIDNVKPQSILPGRQHFRSPLYEHAETSNLKGAERYDGRYSNRSRSRSYSPAHLEDRSCRDRAESEDQHGKDSDTAEDWNGSDSKSERYYKDAEKRYDFDDRLQKKRITSCDRCGNPGHTTRDCYLNTDDEIGGNFLGNVLKQNSPHVDEGIVPTLPTAYDLQAYSQEIFVKDLSRPKSQRSVNGYNGKVPPSHYGSDIGHDLGLCYATFLTRDACEMGLNCPWRHHPLTKAEREWIDNWESGQAKVFLENVNKFWASPDVPVPGRDMRSVADN